MNRGANVTLISGPTKLQQPFGMKVINITTNNEMFNEIIRIYDNQDYVIKAAAVSDYKAEKYSDEKLKEL